MIAWRWARYTKGEKSINLRPYATHCDGTDIFASDILMRIKSKDVQIISFIRFDDDMSWRNMAV